MVVAVSDSDTRIGVGEAKPLVIDNQNTCGECAIADIPEFSVHPARGSRLVISWLEELNGFWENLTCSDLCNAGEAPTEGGV